MISRVSSTFSSKSETVMMESQASQEREGKTQGSPPPPAIPRAPRRIQTRKASKGWEKHK